MKLIIFLTLVYFITISNSIKAQNINIIEPEFIGKIIFVNDSVGNGQFLEFQTSSTQSKVNAALFIPFVNFFAGKVKILSVFNGCCSPMIINKSKNLMFIVKVKDNSIDPETIIKIFKLKSNTKKNNRTIEISSASTTEAKTGNINYINFKSKKYGETSYLIEVDSLENGEYAIINSSNKDVYNLFAVKTE